MVNKCCVRGCPSKNDSSTQRSFHRFPKHSRLLCRRWITAAGIDANPDSVSGKRVCSSHFVNTDFVPSTKTMKLLPNAVPTALLSGQATYDVELESLNSEHIQDAIITLWPGMTLKLKVKNQDPSTSGKKYFATKSSSTPDDTVNNHDGETPLRRLEACRTMNSTLRKKVSSLKLQISSLRKNWNLKQMNKKLSTMRSKKREECQRLRNKINSMNLANNNKLTTIDDTLKSVFTEKQMRVLLNNQHHAKWTNEDIGKAITLKHKNNPYEHLRAMGFPLPSTRTLQRWTQQIIMEPGVLYCVLNLLKNEFEHLNEFDKTCVISFDEMAIDSSVVYDPNEDKIYGPKNNLNAWFVRGLFRPWKQLVAYDFDEQLSEQKYLKLVTDIEECGLSVRATVNDLGGKNRGLWRKLGVKCEVSQPEDGTLLKIKSFCLNPVSNKKIYFFADAPHLLKLLRNNLLTHGLTLEGGYQLNKADFEKLVSLDHAELRANFKLTKEHLNLVGKKKQTVSYAVHLFWRMTAHAWNVVFPNRKKEGEFLLLVADWFDLYNSRYTSEKMPSKTPFGLDIERQMNVLHNMRQQILALRVGTSKGLYPFQRGMLTSIQSLEGLYQDVSGSTLNAKYILTSRLNQDFVENSFSMLRQIGRYNDHPTAVDAKRRLKLLMLSWGGKLSVSASVAPEDEEHQPFVTGRMISSLMDTSTPTEEALQELQQELQEEFPEANELDGDNCIEVLDSMGVEERLEEFGKEYLCGFVASKLRTTHPQLTATNEEIQLLANHSWVKKISCGGLTIPSLAWRNQAALLEEEFRAFHRYSPIKINQSPGVLKGHVKSLIKKYHAIPPEAIQLYIKSRLFIRIKAVNKKLKAEAVEKRQKRSEIIYKIMQQKSKRQLAPEEFDSDDYEDSDDEIVHEDVQERTNNSTGFKEYLAFNSISE